MKVPFALPNTQKIEVYYMLGGTKYRKVMPNPKDNGLLAIALYADRSRIEMKHVTDVRPFAPNTVGY